MSGSYLMNLFYELGSWPVSIVWKYVKIFEDTMLERFCKHAQNAGLKFAVFEVEISHWRSTWGLGKFLPYCLPTDILWKPMLASFIIALVMWLVLRCGTTPIWNPLKWTSSQVKYGVVQRAWRCLPGKSSSGHNPTLQNKESKTLSLNSGLDFRLCYYLLCLRRIVS